MSTIFLKKTRCVASITAAIGIVHRIMQMSHEVRSDRYGYTDKTLINWISLHKSKCIKTGNWTNVPWKETYLTTVPHGFLYEVKQYMLSILYGEKLLSAC